MKKAIRLIPIAVLSAVVISCSNMTPTEQRTLSGAAIGTVGGAAIGGLAGGHSGAGTGALIGAGVGALGGYLYDKNQPD